MQLDYSILYEVIIWAVLFLAVLYFLYRNYIYSVVDPLFTYVYTTAFASVLILYVVSDEKYVIHYFVCQLFLFLGFYFGKKNTKGCLNENKKFNFYDIYIFEKTVYILATIYFLSNIFTVFTRGSAFFSDDPYARETNFQDGFGIFRRINWGIGSFLASSLILLFIKQRKSLFIYMLIGLSLFTMLEGTKSSLLRIVIIVGAMIQHPYVKNNYKIADNIKQYTPVGIIILFAAFFTILLKESSGNYDIFLSFINRLLAGGDSVLYFYLPQNEYLRTHYHPLEFISYIINPITGFLHLTAYVEPFGSVAVSNTQVSNLKTDVYLAPNTPFYIEGQIFFGYFGSFVYSLCIGFCIATFRNLFFNMRKGSYFLLSLLCTLFFHSIALPVETSLFVKSCLDTLLFSVPTYVAVAMVYHKKITLRKLSF